MNQKSITTFLLVLLFFAIWGTTYSLLQALRYSRYEPYQPIDWDATATARYETEVVRISTAISNMWEGHCQYLIDWPSTQRNTDGYVEISVYEHNCLGNLTENELQSVFDMWIEDAAGQRVIPYSLDPFVAVFNGETVNSVEGILEGYEYQKAYYLPDDFVVSGVTKIQILPCNSSLKPAGSGELFIYNCGD